MEAFGSVKKLIAWKSDTLERDFEIPMARLICTDLLCGNDMREGIAHLGRREGEKVVVDIGDDVELEPCRESLESGDCVWEWLPISNGVGERCGFGWVRGEP